MSQLLSFTNTGPLDGTSLIVPPYVTGRVYDSRLVTPGAFATGAMVADRLYATPFWVGPQGFAADRFCMYVGTGAGNGRIGAYTASPTSFLPTSLIIDWGQVDVSTNGQKAFTISTTLTSGSLPYWVWLACVFSGTPTLGKIDLAASMLFGDADINGGGSITGVYGSSAFGALPSTFPTITYANCPIFGLRKA